MKQHAITLAHGTYTELKDTEGAKGTEDKLLWLDIQGTVAKTGRAGSGTAGFAAP